MYESRGRLTERFDRAMLYAAHVHGGQVRKGTSVPYVAHLLAVAATVLEYGGDEDMAIQELTWRSPSVCGLREVAAEFDCDRNCGAVCVDFRPHVAREILGHEVTAACAFDRVAVGREHVNPRPAVIAAA
jgi:hypothetical protein